ncbi:OB-fold domain-containing protein [Rhizorhabdus wittichii]|jgi:uncharacterized OB-fold protein|uniref:OB-fold domain-containing protein n=1 Tax=Rhizorhabdus wittichii TaxID=160791 RepID=A0A975HCI3_9SPHN|nr:OB-fold domain-containing protein [Rhizorhabdus wittichii]QTH20293.1 OB-fold domain-containing protein [Rhizorhabdus wittichii]
MTMQADKGASFVDIWWDRVRAGEKVVQKCGQCGTLQLHPRRRCNNCASADLSFEPVSGEATLYSFTEILRNAPSDFMAQLPYALAIVRLAEGPQMLTRIVGVDADSLQCDMPMRWTLAEIGERMVPCFAPVAGASV